VNRALIAVPLSRTRLTVFQLVRVTRRGSNRHDKLAAARVSDAQGHGGLTNANGSYVLVAQLALREPLLRGSNTDPYALRVVVMALEIQALQNLYGTNPLA
jgi:hypothetical protein